MARSFELYLPESIIVLSTDGSIVKVVWQAYSNV